MNKFDLIIRGGKVVTHREVIAADIAVLDEHIVQIQPDLPGSATETINAAGLHVFPGVIDSHVHFNDPGRAEWEGIASGSTESRPEQGGDGRTDVGGRRD